MPRTTWIQTLGSKKLEQRALRPEMVGSIEELAHSLAGEYRFTRQTEKRYTVAQHCVLGSRLMAPAVAGAFLLHELSEVYLPDVAGPMKPFVWAEINPDDAPLFEEVFPARLSRYEGQTALRFDAAPEITKVFVRWTELERQHTHVILKALGCSSIEPLLYSPEVQIMDAAMLAAEKRDLNGPEPEPWGLTVAPPPNFTITQVWTPDEAKREFLERFKELFHHPRVEALSVAVPPGPPEDP